MGEKQTGNTKVIKTTDETNNKRDVINSSGGIVIKNNENNSIMETLSEIEKTEKDICNLPLVFSEIFKDEINATEENDLYEAVKKIIRKYCDDDKALAVLNEFTGALCSGASLEEILLIARDEALSPTPATGITVDGSCRIDGDIQ